ncbi:MAG TPA: ATP-dependent helicase HrpB [Steroidobacteraceae bacterium]|nr:ATP-dependent helicase HrpB [Steroidobacteraceae bacterium]
MSASSPFGEQQPLVSALLAATAGHRDVVLQAPTGAGKSTLVPLALHTQQRPARILLLEPRRLAARAVAARMASLLNEPVGATVGYRMRLDTRVSAATRIEVVTEGVLTRMLQEDPALEGVAWLIFDEYHERSLPADLGLALALDARVQLGAPYRLLIMSATLEIAAVARLLDAPGVVQVPGRAFEVQVHYLGRGLPALPTPGARVASEAAAEPLERGVARAVQRALQDTTGDVLVFLPGVGEIRRTQALLLERAIDAQILPLYGELPSAAQDAVMSPPSGASRRVVLATNVAETSVTIPRVTAVVDSGLARRSRFDPVSGMSRLTLGRISRAASEQRAGRAGRLAPGICLRLWSEGAQAQLAASTTPEILDADLAPLALELARWGIGDAERLRWLDVPPAAHLAQARELLEQLGALDARQRLTPRGQRMARLPVHPRLARMLLAAGEHGSLPLAASLAALLSERDLLRTRVAAERDVDVRTRLELLSNEANPDVQRVLRTARQLEQLVRAELAAARRDTDNAAAAEAGAGAGGSAGQAATGQWLEEPGALLALAFPDRLGQRREGAEGRYLLANGRGAVLRSHGALARAPFIVAVELDDREREALIDIAAPVSATAIEALLADRISTEELFGWDEGSGALIARRVRRLQALTLEERALPVPDDTRAAQAMLELLQRWGPAALPWSEESRILQARMEFVRGLERADLDSWPASDDASLAATLPIWLAPWLAGVRSRAALARIAFSEALLARLSHPQQRALESLAPRRLVVPSGAHWSIEYRGERAPSLAVPLQEMFGVAETPRIGEGKVPVTLELLSPARRPLQITRDLGGFWRGSYAEVRRQMRGRYPKHDWPEDPLTARPARRRGVPRAR